MKKLLSKTKKSAILYIVPILSILPILSTSALTFQNETDLTFTFNPSINITLSGDSGTDLIIDNLTPGNSADSNIITITSSSNAYAGYSLYSTVGSSTSNYTDLRLSSDNTTNVFSSLSTNKASLSNFDDSTWGYSYCNNSSNDCTSSTNWVSGSVGSTSTGYNGLPLYDDSATTGIKLAGTTNTSGTSTIQFKIGARASDSQASGIYANTINFIGVGNVITTNYTMSYNGNGAESNVPASQSGTTTDATFNLSDTVPVRAGYDFKGWCTVNNTSNPTTCNDGTNGGNNGNGDGVIIQPGNLYVIGSTATSFTGTVYAVWQDGKYYMQDLTPSIIAQLLPDVNSTTTVYDKRDDQAYTIAKLADNKYWMTENLNLAGGTAIDSTNSDVTSSYISTFTTSNNLTKNGNTIVLPASSKTGFDTNNYSYVYNTGNKTDNCSDPGCYSYYSWDAATLGSGRDIGTDNTNAPYSICPKGWHLPTTYNGANSTTDFRALAIAYGGTETIQSYNDSTSPTGSIMYGRIGSGTTSNYIMAGYYDNNIFDQGNSYGYYLSATSYIDNSTNRNLYIVSDALATAASSYRRAGKSIRCLFETRTISDITYMQEMTHNIARNTQVNTTTTLKDSRDNQDYTVAKLLDGKVWMTKNMNIAGGTTLTSDKTDFGYSYTIPTTQGWQSGGKLPTSSNTGFSQDNYAYLYNSNSTNCSASNGCYSYYSWDVTTLGSGRNISTENTDAPYSICPRNWRLPITGSTTDSGWKRGDFYRLATAYGVNLESTPNANTTLFYDKLGSSSIANFLLTGHYGSNTFVDHEVRGRIWASTSGSSVTGAYNMNFTTDYINTATNNYRLNGFAIRCLARD